MLNYEYKVEKFSRHYGVVENLINGLAQKGWRLICVSDGFHYFERPVNITVEVGMSLDVGAVAGGGRGWGVGVEVENG